MPPVPGARCSCHAAWPLHCCNLQLERKALKHAVHEAQQRLRQAEAASEAAEAARSATEVQKGVIAQALADARYSPQAVHVLCKVFVALLLVQLTS